MKELGEEVFGAYNDVREAFWEEPVLIQLASSASPKLFKLLVKAYQTLTQKHSLPEKAFTEAFFWNKEENALFLLEEDSALLLRTIEKYWLKSIHSGMDKLASFYTPHSEEDSELKKKALFAAVRHGRKEVLEEILKITPVNQREAGSGSPMPLHIATEKGSVEIARLLVSYGADTTEKAQVGGRAKTPWDMVKENKSLEFRELRNFLKRQPRKKFLGFLKVSY